MEYDGNMAIAKGRHIRRIGKRNQVTIPAEILEELHLGPGVEVEVARVDGEVRVKRAAGPVTRARGLLKRPDQRSLTMEEEAVATRDAEEEIATARYLRANDRG